MCRKAIYWLSKDDVLTMPIYEPVGINFEKYEGPSQNNTGVFVYSDKPTDIAWPLGKTPKPSEGRQAHFNNQLLRLAHSLRSTCLPIRIEWASGECNQMDKGCIGHSYGSDSLIQSVAIDSSDQLTHIILWNSDAPNQ